MPSSLADFRAISGAVEMPRLLEALGIEANLRTRRAPCVLHGGANPTAFAWTESGLWHCHSCGAGGDRIFLVRAVRKCNFRDAVEFLAQLAGVTYAPRVIPRGEIERIRRNRVRAEKVAWHIHDEIVRLRCFYRDGLQRAERLQKRFGGELLRASTQGARDSAWDRLARLAPVGTFFFAAWRFIGNATPGALARFALASTVERRRFMLEGVTR